MAFFRRMRRQPTSDPVHGEATTVDWQRLVAYLRPYKPRLAVILVALALFSAAGLAFPLVIVQLLDSVLNQPDGNLLTALTVGLLGLFLFQSAMGFVQSYNLSYVGERIVLDVRTALYTRLQELSLDFYANRRVGEIVSRISSDVTQLRSVLTNNITQLLGQLVSLVGSVVILFTLNPRLTAFTLVLVPTIAVVAIVFGRSFRGLSTQAQDELANATVTVEESLQGIRVVKSFAREQYEINRYEQAMHRTFNVTIRLAVFRSLFGSTMAFLGFGAIAAVLWFGGQEVLAGRLSVPLLSGFLIYGISIAASVGQLAGLYGQFQEALGAVHRVFEILDTKPTIVDAPHARALNTVDGRITFDDVSFSYDDRENSEFRIQNSEVGQPKNDDRTQNEANDKDSVTSNDTSLHPSSFILHPSSLVLRNISLDIAPGEIVALVGPSGAGKSTLFNLIPRFYDPTSGRVAVDGVDLRAVTQQSLRSQIGIVPQDTVLFGGSVRENIVYGRLEASEDEIIAAAKAANAHDFITAMPQGYDTIVGERGVKLSGGQRQRVAIARAILKNPRILLLDEATSALDSESEELVQEALERLMQNRTTVIIAHRLSTIKVAHRIAVLDAGRIIELGTHAELMALNGLYARLYAMQFREDDVLVNLER